MSAGSRLRSWFRRSARPLPWRSAARDPYRVLISELMLQQTQVERVVPAYQAFLVRFPSLEALAGAEEQAVLAAWSGLGYYRRARALHRLAREVVRDGGRLPESAAELARLPGVGPYTAAAVASLAFGACEPAVDGNVVRVAARVLAFTGDARSARGRRLIGDWVRSLLTAGHAGAVNEALMELGATVCLPREPSCGGCPLARECRARAAGTQHRYPAARRRRPTVAVRWVAACCVDDQGRWLVRQVTAGPILVGLWLPPIAELEDGLEPIAVARRLVPGRLVGPPQGLPAVRHTVTHRRITVHPVRLPVGRTGGRRSGRWIDPIDDRLPTSSLLSKLFGMNILHASG